MRAHKSPSKSIKIRFENESSIRRNAERPILVDDVPEKKKRRATKDKETGITVAEGKQTSDYRRLRAARIADVRDKMDVTRYMNTLHHIDEELFTISSHLRDGIMINGDGDEIKDVSKVKKGVQLYLIPRCSESDERHYKIRIMALDKRASLALRMLNKVLPDLKPESVEDNDKDDNGATLRRSLEMITEKYS